ncbi:MAG TPA: glycosyltransferase [Thermodesulfobacteriota bacterium]|nr:glycosyltransferase [Thermodesulfobacteriota bacterium]
MSQSNKTKDLETPSITVVVSTRNRGDSIVRTVSSILSIDYPDFELRIVDQSDNDTTKVSLQPFFDDPRVRYVRSATKGLSAGRNVGIAETKSEFIAFTDDDCEVPSDWLHQLVAAFNVDSNVGIVFGNLLSGPYDSALGFIPVNVRKEPILLKSVRESYLVQGVGACMALQRGVWQKLGGFDQMLGVGALFKAGEEVDFALRVLRAGYFVFETPNVSVIHHGFRSWEQGRALIHSYWYGTGAMMVKQLKCGHWSIIETLFSLAWRWAFGQSLAVSSFGNHSHKFLRLMSFIEGFITGMFTSVNRRNGHYVY